MVLVLPRLGQRPEPAAAAGPARSRQPTPSRTLLPEASLSARWAARADSLVVFGLAQRGTPYVWAGTSPLTGFDCSGFIMYTFARFGVAVPHATALLIDVGRPVARNEAQPGDIVVFAGTDPTSTAPGHAGIVISQRGERPLRFVHASSSRREPFVKVNQVEGSDYERRFLQVRRVLGPGAVATTHPKVPVPASTNAPVVHLPTRTIGVAPAAAPAAKPPRQLATKKLPRNTAASRPATRRKIAPKTSSPRKRITHKGKTTTRPARQSAKKHRLP